MSLYKQKGSSVWSVSIRHNGQRVRRSTGATDQREAEEIHDRIKADLWHSPVPSKASGPTWQDACVAWLKASPRSESERYSLRALDYPDRPLSECTADSFRDVLAAKSPATSNRYRAMVQAILHLSGISIKIPLRKVKEGRLRFLSHEEWERLRAELPGVLRTLADFSIYTGLRQFNVTHLKWEQIDLVRKVAWVHSDEAKAGKPIGIPLSDEAVAVLRGQIGKGSVWVFPYKGRGRKEGAPITKIKTAWQLAMERAGLGYFERETDRNGKTTSKKWVGDVTWHTLRHTWASWHVMSGTPLEVLQKLGGWADLKMVQNYSHLAPEYLASYANNAKPWKAAEAVA